MNTANTASSPDGPLDSPRSEPVSLRSSLPGISIVIPCRDEIGNLPTLLAELNAMLDDLGRPAEIIIVDDASRDGSWEFLESAARRDSRLRPVRLAKGAGQSAALAAGFARARGAVIVTLDADLQNDPADVPRLLEALNGADVVSGIRRTRHDLWNRRVASAIANTVRRAMIGDRITDIGCSLKAYRRAALDGLPMFATVHRFLPALCQMRGDRVVEIEVSHRPRRHGVTHYGNAGRLAHGLADLVGVRWLRSRLIPRPPPREDP